MSGPPSRWRWRPALLIASIVLVLAVALALFSARTYAVTSPVFCTAACHSSSKPVHFASAGHDGVSCQSCHTLPGSGLSLFAAGLVGGRTPKHGHVALSSCTSCHGERNSKWAAIADTAGHRQHPPHLKGVDCLSCHRAASHGRKTVAETCRDCHADDRLHVERDAGGEVPECLSCHNFSAVKRGQAGLTTIDACGRCHGEESSGVRVAGIKPKSLGTPVADVVRASHLHGAVDCKLCHQPHGKKHNGGGPDGCPKCHHIEIGTKDAKLPVEHRTCNKCHEQHAPVSLAGAHCAECHEQAREREGDARSTALRHDECASCHVPHSWTAAPNGCVNCHADQATLVFTKSPKEHGRCVNCHEVHGPPATGATCGSCHKPNAAKMRAAPERHKDCTSCHTPHSPLVQAPNACADCHRALVHQVVAKGPPAHETASCSGCHTLHGNPKADSRVCGNCHKDQSARVQHATVNEHRRCESCHAPHRFSISKEALPCNKCHAKIATSPGSHSGSCLKCHGPHGSPSVPRDRCLGCHQTIDLRAPPKNTEHARCGSCHVPHLAAKAALQQCATCHQDKSRVAQSWPAASAHREACNRCHQPHNVLTTTACANCHAKEQAAGGGGRHQCKQCHAPHQAPPPDARGWWNRCASCHAKQAAAVKTGTSHDKCNECHKPHKFSAPECTSCHTGIASKGAHRVKEHADCGACHDTHSASLPARAQCLSCHKDRSEHHPMAKNCQGCHPFQ